MLLRSIALSQIDNIYEDCAHIYTDGSKDPVRNRTAYGIHTSSNVTSETTSISVRLPNGQSVYTAELEAIHHALRLAHSLKDKRAVILSDSLSALKSIASKFSKSRPDILQLILEEILKLRRSGKEIQLCWIPSHIDIPGNERADKLARQGLELTEVTDLAYSTSEIKSMIKHSIWEEWQTVWTNSTEGRWYHTLRPNVKGGLPCPHHSRQVDTAITKLRLGATNTSYQQCNICQKRATVSHILLECPKFDAARQELRLEVDTHTLSTTTLLDGTNLRPIINFLLKTNHHQYI